MGRALVSAMPETNILGPAGRTAALEIRAEPGDSHCTSFVSTWLMATASIATNALGCGKVVTIKARAGLSIAANRRFNDKRTAGTASGSATYTLSLTTC